MEGIGFTSGELACSSATLHNKMRKSTFWLPQRSFLA
jgi:hypothetical protein